LRIEDWAYKMLGMMRSISFPATKSAPNHQ